MKTNPKKILKELSLKDKFYMPKLKILNQLIVSPDGGHIIDREIVDWCNKVGFKTSDHHDAGVSWWTCSV